MLHELIEPQGRLGCKGSLEISSPLPSIKPLLVTRVHEQEDITRTWIYLCSTDDTNTVTLVLDSKRTLIG